MNRIVKDILIAILIVIVLWAVFVTIDCIRLRGAEYHTTPIITLDQQISKDETIYVGLGYNVKYIHEKEIMHEEGSDAWAVGTGACGAEFRLFGTWLIWAYIE